MKVTFLGTGTSFGVPVVGCDCPVCRSGDPRNARTRHSLLLEHAGGKLLVDTPPELRLQLVRAAVSGLDAVFLTHTHADHVHGLDDLRIFSARSGEPLPLYVAREFEAELRQRFAYVWDRPDPESAWTPVPELELRAFEDREGLEAAGFTLVPIAFPHGYYRSYGFRVGDLAVVVDAKRVPEDAVPLLTGVRVLIINALWFGDPHPSHFNVEEAVEVARRLGAEHTYLTHLSHRLEHSQLTDRLPPGISPAYDGLSVEM
ncbi:MAG: MBL fold metallo-hydrolase [Gemmatimonadota bacterium]